MIKIVNQIKIISNNEGMVLPSVLSLIIAFIILSGAVLTVIQSNLGIVARNVKSQEAFNIAEAGANYYLWHLSHSPDDFKDGQSTPATPDPELGYGPYVHDYVDDNSNKTGTYTLWIKPEGTGSTIVTVRSIGKLNNGSISRTVETRIGAKSFASYGLVSDSAFWVGNTEAVEGPVHSNVGIRMDGSHNDTVTSANTTYTNPSNLGGGGTKPGVWCSSSVTTPINCDARDKSNWSFPVTSVDFNSVNSSLCDIKKIAFEADAATTSLASLSNACSQTPSTRTDAYIPRHSSSYQTRRGYLIELKPTGKYDLYRVDNENDRQSPYTAALSETLLESDVDITAEGIIFVEDNVWVRSDPTFSGRVTIASGRLASTSESTDITIADDLLYGNKNGSDAIGLIAEESVYVAPYASPTSGAFNYEINAALLAMSGDVYYRYPYRADTSRRTRGWVNANQTFTFYGSIGVRQGWTWLWAFGGSSGGDSVYSGGTYGYISGFYNNTTQYDENLLYAPPPNYPVTEGFEILSWREVLTLP